MLESRTIAEDVHYHCKDMVGFMVRCMPLKEMDMIVDSIDQADMLGELEHGRDSCIIDRLSSLSKFVLHVIGSENGIGI